MKMDLAKTFVAGVVVIGIVTAFGLHAKGLAKLGTSAGSASSKVLHTAETGQ